ncbi:unnamed protein product [Polarella glacialis]|uniref:Aminotransferase class V domain-containing protein n=1 Tax=Polarella glacialis TaxID=89957 RepID=A0A813IL10_POLGL|nr:unnamed protein product [Polarella glacialis]
MAGVLVADAWCCLPAAWRRGVRSRPAAAGIRALARGAASCSGDKAAGFDIDRARRETRGCGGSGGAHKPWAAFLNSAGSSLPPAPVADMLTDYLADEEMRGGYATADRRSAELEAFYPAVARLLGCQENEVAFTESATRSWTLLFHSLRFAPGDRIITSASDYGSNFVGYLQARDRCGTEIVVIPDDASGQIDLEKLRSAAAEPRARLISLNHVPTGGGVVQPAREVGAIARELGIPFLLDACQSVGQLQVDVKELGCDMLTATGRKFLRGPRGTGLLFVREGFLPQLDPFPLDQEGARLISHCEMERRPDARCFEHYEYNFAGKAALAVAVNYALHWGLPAIEARVKDLAQRLRRGLAQLPGVVVTDTGRELCGIVTFTVEWAHEGIFSASKLKALLQAKGLALSASEAGGGGSTVWFQGRGLSGVVRASPHYFNTEEEVDLCITVVAELVAEMQQACSTRQS